MNITKAVDENGVVIEPSGEYELVSFEPQVKVHYLPESEAPFQARLNRCLNLNLNLNLNPKCSAGLEPNCEQSSCHAAQAEAESRI